MKKVYSIALALLVLFGHTVNAQSCCKKPAGNDMKALALNKSFKASHEAPLPLKYTAESGAMIQSMCRETEPQIRCYSCFTNGGALTTT